MRTLLAKAFAHAHTLGAAAGCGRIELCTPLSNTRLLRLFGELVSPWVAKALKMVL